jgi:1-phosphatidylinositol-4-phosphate 5-kinase
MTSVFDTPLQIHSIYDLKGSALETCVVFAEAFRFVGSRVGREATEKEKASGGVLKDNDLVDADRKWHLGSKKEKLMEQIEKDAMFLASLNIMDYSLLVSGIGVACVTKRTRFLALLL